VALVSHSECGLVLSLGSRLFKNLCMASFIHYGDLYSAPSRLLLRSATDPCTAKKKSFEARVECVNMQTETHEFYA